MRVILIIIFLAGAGYSQDTTDVDKNIINIVYDDAMLYFGNCAAFFVSPFSADAEELLYAAGITGSTILLIYQDGKLKNFFGRDTYKPINGDFWDIPTAYGVVEYSNVLSAGIYAAGLFTDNVKVKDTGRLLMETITVSGMTALLLRYLTGRMRPPYTEDHLAFKGFGTKEAYQSFPSGHAVVGVAMSTVFAEQIDTWWSRTFFYGLAGLSAFVRLYNNQHWFTDVFTGSILGLGAGLFMVNREQNRLGETDKGRLSIVPGINGMSLIYSF